MKEQGTLECRRATFHDVSSTRRIKTPGTPAPIMAPTLSSGIVGSCLDEGRAWRRDLSITNNGDTAKRKILAPSNSSGELVGD